MKDLKASSRVFRALGSQSGLKIFLLLSRTKELCVSDITERVGLSMSAVSHQLQKMEAAGIVESRQEGRTICYLLCETKLVKDLRECVKNLI